MLLIHGDRILLTNLNSRGWDLPGGHVELGETAFDAMRRELWEETGATFGQAELIGYEKLMIHAPMPIPYAYPYPVSYLVFYWGRMNRQTALEANVETRGTGFFSFAEASALACIQHNAKLFEAAFNRNKMMP
ncbi:NUDIX hydrolase [Brevibacillus centrosporus]|uniref:NUDIX hydrolase n=1 Tax=Brevibacillus centrosporus TaxID=54910 RepID=UPI0039865ADC